MLHDGFRVQSAWFDFMPGADRVGLDLHSYLAFTVHDFVMNNDDIAVQLLVTAAGRYRTRVFTVPLAGFRYREPVLQHELLEAAGDTPNQGHPLGIQGIFVLIRNVP